MTRREFLKKVGGILAAIPVVSLLLTDTKAESGLTEEAKPNTVKGYAFFDSISFNELLQRKFEEESQPNLIFLERTKLVNCLDDQEILAYGGYASVFAADIIMNDATVIEDTGQYARSNSIPNVKIGSRVSERTISLATRVNNEIDKTNTNKILSDYREVLASNLALGLKQTLNLQILNVMLGGTEEIHGMKFKMDAPKGLHIQADWSKPLTAIKAHTEKLANKFGQTVNRMTLGTPAYKKLLASDEFQTAYSEYRKENAERFDEYINLYSSKNNGVEPSKEQVMLHFAPTVLNKNVGVVPDIYDATYRVRNDKGNSKAKRVLPENRVLFSNSNSDLDMHTLDYAQGIVVETIVSKVITGAPDFGGESFGPIGYFTGNRDLNPPDIRAWAVMRGLPRLHNKTAFSSFTI